MYGKIVCDVKPKLTINVLTLYGPIVKPWVAKLFGRELWGGVSPPSKVKKHTIQQHQYHWSITLYHRGTTLTLHS